MWFRKKVQSEKKKDVQIEPKKTRRLVRNLMFVSLGIVTILAVGLSYIGLKLAYEQGYRPFIAQSVARLEQRHATAEAMVARQTVVAQVAAVNRARYATAVKVDIQTAAAQAFQPTIEARTNQRAITATIRAELMADAAIARASAATAEQQAVGIADSVRTATAVHMTNYPTAPPSASNCTSAALIFSLAIGAVVWRANKLTM